MMYRDGYYLTNSLADPAAPLAYRPMDMELTIGADYFPFERVLSLDSLIRFWKELAADEGSTRHEEAIRLVKKAEPHPELHGSIEDPEVLARHGHLLDQMMGVVFPLAIQERTYAAALPPYSNLPFYMTSGFARLELLDQLNAEVSFNGKQITTEEMLVARTIKAYHLILKKFYGIRDTFQFQIILTKTDEETDLKRYYKIIMDPTFVEIKAHGTVPKLSEANQARLLAEPMNLPRWLELLPPEHFSFHGFNVMNAVDVTDQTVLSLLKHDLLLKDAMRSKERINRLQRHLRTLLGCPDLAVGLIGMGNSTFSGYRGARPLGHSLLMSKNVLPECSYMMDSTYAHAITTREPVIIRDLSQEYALTGFEEHILEQGYLNLLVCPLFYEGELVGLLELASPSPGAINAFNSMKLIEVNMLFATAMKRSLLEHEDRVQAIIKQTSTAIHPIVEWRFREAAYKYLQEMEENAMAQMEPIVFHDIYPLYGLSDIRGSSEHRNAAIQADLLEQLGLALAVIIEASMVRPLPILDEIGYRVAMHASDIKDGLHSGDETATLEFLRNDVEALFEHLGNFGENVARRIKTYRDALDPELGIVYKQRRNFEESVMLINHTISTYIDRQEDKAQEMYPHFFEKYKSDGVDYNIYIGASLVEHQPFHDIYLRNLRLWQLMLQCGIVWKMEELQAKLKMPLDTAHLVLVQHLKLAIRFRYDEKKFDVDGAYNARYEIVKKRIDKARIRETSERLTQPRMIAIVYSTDKEGQEYRRYIGYLQASGYLTDEVEDVMLEDQQGAQGLMALRVTVAEHPPGDFEQLASNLPMLGNLQAQHQLQEATEPMNGDGAVTEMPAELEALLQEDVVPFAPPEAVEPSEEKEA